MTPAVGTHLSGQARRVSIADIMREHGVREGPSPRAWRRATILVSREGFASRQEMDYWNFFAERLADRNRRGTPTANGFVPFRVATNDAVNLSTRIKPRRGERLPETLDTDAVEFGASDWRGVTFSSPVPGRFEANRETILTGRVTATDAVDFGQISLTFWSDGIETPVTFSGAVSRGGDFSVPVRFTDAQRGRYGLAIYLFWPDSGPQYPRASLTSIAVE
jgi:hypothetical protein